MIESIFNNFVLYYNGMIEPVSRVYPLYLISALMLAIFAYIQVERAHAVEDETNGRRDSKANRPTVLQYVFDPRVMFHTSTRQDIKYFFVNSFVYYALISQFLISEHAFATIFHSLLIDWFDTLSVPLISGGIGVVLYTILAVIALDLGVYIMHYLFHRIPVLWEFHKVHHSAEELNPMTLFRMHPVDLFLTGMLVAIFNGLAFAGILYLTGSKPTMSTLFGVNIIIFLFYLLGYNLRHSHMWLSYSMWLSRILVSPAQHQIHHSSDPKHVDKNFGLIFSFWDQLMGTCYIPRKYEKLEYGLSRDNPNPFKSTSDLYFKPFVWAGTILKELLATPSGRRNALIIGLLVAAFVALGQSQYHKAMIESGPGLPSVKLANLTWTEIHNAVENGYRTVIVPTGGTEQNGPFVILGKHHLVIDYTSHAIARTLGETLVAPVMDYVPEGETGPKPTGHMQFAGTLSIPEAVFESVLEHTARSLRVHGFREIYFLGDSGGNQASQKRVAKKLMTEWSGKGIRVASLDQYYAANGQFTSLQEAGYKDQQIGWHSGMRDTSEVLTLDPRSVRITKRNVLDGHPQGFSGAASEASAKIGKKMLALKVSTGVAQVRALRAEEDIEKKEKASRE